MDNFNKKGGISILGLLVLAIIIIFALSYFHISIKAVIESPAGQYNINYVGGDSKNPVNSYFVQPVLNFWNNTALPFLNSFTSNVQKNINSQPNTTP
jgi:hypothetical protein